VASDIVGKNNQVQELAAPEEPLWEGHWASTKYL
jgi:hypothetical protein